MRLGMRQTLRRADPGPVRVSGNARAAMPRGVVRSRAAPSPSDPGPQLPRPVWGRSAGFGLCPALQGGEARVRGPTGRCRVLFRYCTCSPVLFATLYLPILYATYHGGSGIGVLLGPHRLGRRPHKPRPGPQRGLKSNTVRKRVLGFQNTRDMSRIIWGGIRWQKERGCRCNRENGIALPDD